MSERLSSSITQGADPNEERSTSPERINPDGRKRTDQLSGENMLTRDYEAPDRLAYDRCLHFTGSDSLPCLPTAALTSNFRETEDAKSETFSLLSVLVDALPKGLIVLSINQAIVYWNQNARRLCQKLSASQRYWTPLPTVIAELCQELATADMTHHEPMLLDYQTPERAAFRLTASWLSKGSNGEMSPLLNQQSYILITVEDRDEVLQQDIQVEQKKFQLTNREAEVWLLLRQEYSYQAIATKLHISLNTVKTHIRNIHAKRHPYQSLPA
ncbi:MAG: LuxR C-terminal-related transcriptional regulator [Leptolyngbya sp. BL-A-14]